MVLQNEFCDIKQLAVFHGTSIKNRPQEEAKAKEVAKMPGITRYHSFVLNDDSSAYTAYQCFKEGLYL